MTAHTLSAAGAQFIKDREGLRLRAYLCSAGVPTIGYGCTFYADGAPVKMSDPTITEKEADEMFDSLIKEFVDAVNKNVAVEISQNAFDALVSFTFNVGPAKFASSTLAKKLNAGDFLGAAGEFDRWVYAGKQVVSGLKVRRAHEKKLFLS